LEHAQEHDVARRLAATGCWIGSNALGEATIAASSAAAWAAGPTRQAGSVLAAAAAAVMVYEK